MRLASRFASLMIAACASLPLCSHASLGITGSSVSAVPGSLVEPMLTIDFGSGYDLGAVDLSLVFDPNVLTARPDLATVQYGGDTLLLADALAALSALTPPPSVLDVNLGPDTVDPSLQSWSISFLTGLDETPAFVPVPVAGTARFIMPFEFAGSVPQAYAIEASGSFSDTGVLNGIGTEQHFAVSMLVTAVPEPASASLWIAGLGLLILSQRLRHMPGSRKSLATRPTGARSGTTS